MAKKTNKKLSRKPLGRKDLRKTRGGVMRIPRVGDEVVVSFQPGDVNRPVVLGSLWQKDPPPESGK
ncbi:MAG TPA: phage baseplate assembly protein V [Planctomycetota bacterium]|nr:phage baseplate assembly protein V [Planctomycetota bacterium]